MTQWDRDRAFASKIGLSYVFDPVDDAALEQVRAATGGRGATVVVEASGSSAGRLVALGAVAIGGRVVLVGFGDADNVVDLQATVIQKQLDVFGTWMFPLPDLQEMLFDISLRGISIKPLITGNYSIDDAAEAWRGFDQGGPGKTVVTWDERRRRRLIGGQLRLLTGRLRYEGLEARTPAVQTGSGPGYRSGSG